MLDPVTLNQVQVPLPLRSQFDDPNDPTINNIFCAGLSVLPSGNVLLTGGQTRLGINFGLNYANVFNYNGNGGAGSWNDTTPPNMAHGRWYPTNTQLGFGTVLVMSGGEFDRYQDGAPVFHFVFTPEIWEPTGPGVGYFRSLSGPTQDNVLPYYPWIFVDPRPGHEGWVFNAGAGTNTNFLDTSGAGTWNGGPSRDQDPVYSSARSYGSAVQYGPGRYMIVGGRGPDGAGFRPTETAEVINLYDANPQWQATGSMANYRKYVNATVLPNGQVLATGGTSADCGNEADENWAIINAELWDPGTGQWSYAGTTSEARLYHSVALLLPDARVLVGGGGEGGACDGRPFQWHLTAQIYEPAYLFRGARPVIGGIVNNTSHEVGYGEDVPFWVLENSDNIAQVNLVRLPSVTHSFNENQGFYNLPIVSRHNIDDRDLTVHTPSRWEELPPGHYMMFALNYAGVPSVALIIRVRDPNFGPHQG